MVVCQIVLYLSETDVGLIYKIFFPYYSSFLGSNLLVNLVAQSIQGEQQIGTP